MTGQGSESRNCLETTELEALIADALPDDAVPGMLAHLENCLRCQQSLEDLSGTRTFRREFLFEPESSPVDDAERRQFVERIKVESSFTADLAERAAGGQDSGEIELGFLAPPEREGSLGKLDAFEISEIIGRGGMGLVLRAHDPELRRDIAIKVLAPGLATSEKARDRFMREARAAAAIDHENVLPIHSVNRNGELPYFTMPIVEGQSLQEFLDARGAPLSVEEIVRIGGAVASGLAAAHEQNLIHRDIKPANVLLDSEGGRVWLVDFGLARAVEDHSVTLPGTVVGTPQFMAPEQLDDHPSTTRSDLFSLGTLFYYMATGRPPFAGKSTASLIRKIIDFTPPSPAERNGSLPQWLSELIESLLQKNPEDRPGTAAEVARTIQSNWHRSGEGKPRLLLGVTLACATVVAIAALFLAFARREAEPFRLLASGEAFTTLAEALEAARDGAVIEITQSYVRLQGAANAGSKTLTLRPAAEIGHGVIDFTELPNRPAAKASSRALIETRADLTLEDLTLARVHAVEGHQLDPGHAPLITAHGGRLALTNCRFELQQSKSSAPLAAIIVSGAAGCAIVDCTFLCRDSGTAVLFRQETDEEKRALTVTLDRNLFIGTSFLVFEHAFPRPIEVQMRSNLISAILPFTFMDGHLWTGFDAQLRDNIFSMPVRPRPSVIRVAEESVLVAMRENLLWDGEGNTYAAHATSEFLEQLPYLRVDRTRRPEARLAGWHGWSESVSELGYKTLALTAPIKIPAELSLDAVAVGDALPETMRGFRGDPKEGVLPPETGEDDRD